MTSRNAASLRIDESRLGAWASSGNAVLALSLVMADSTPHFTCAALCYGLTLDLDGATVVADAARTWGFANPCAGKSVDDLSRDTALFLARAGEDAIPGLNDMLDRFIARALARNLPITVANHPTGPHAFDILEDSPTTRAIIRQILGFLELRLAVDPSTRSQKSRTGS